MEGKETGYRQALAFDGFQDDSFPRVRDRAPTMMQQPEADPDFTGCPQFQHRICGGDLGTMTGRFRPGAVCLYQLDRLQMRGKWRQALFPPGLGPYSG